MWGIPVQASGAGAGGGGGVTDHGALTGLGDDDHTQYALWAAIQASQLCNEIMNHPSLEGADNALPEWWENGANSALTEVDVAGEAGITETWKRCLKVATSAVAAYSYQRYTYADQPRIHSGRALSAIFAVWSVSAKTARIRLITSAGTTVVSSGTIVAGWTILTAENLPLDGTYVDIRLEVDNGTAYFVPLGINIGAKAVPLKPRGLRYRDTVSDTNLVGDVDPGAAFVDVDCTANTSPLTAIAKVVVGYRNETTTSKTVYLRRNGTAKTWGGSAVTSGSTTYTVRADSEVLLDDQQIFEFGTDAIATNTEHVWIDLIGWYEWE